MLKGVSAKKIKYVGSGQRNFPLHPLRISNGIDLMQFTTVGYTTSSCVYRAHGSHCDQTVKGRTINDLGGIYVMIYDPAKFESGKWRATVTATTYAEAVPASMLTARTAGTRKYVGSQLYVNGDTESE